MSLLGDRAPSLDGPRTDAEHVHGAGGRTAVPTSTAQATSASLAAPATPATPATPAPAAAAGRPFRPLVLVVDDEESYRHALTVGLTREGFAVEVAADGQEALRLFHRLRPQLVLLDVMLPGQSGVELCQRLRAVAPVPIIMVTARNSEIDVVVGLEVGAADYVTKPFQLRELVARMRAVLRRGASPGAAHDDVMAVGPIQLDVGRREVTVSGRAVELSRKEFDLLALLMAQPGQVVTREWCIDRLWWDQELADTRTLDTHVKRLRRKIEPNPSVPRHLVTVRGVGFRLEP